MWQAARDAAMTLRARLRTTSLRLVIGITVR
jgi:hypothetical protein